MSSVNFNNSEYINKGTTLVPFGNINNPLSEEDINKLVTYCEGVDKEFVTTGDAGEENFVHVGRFMTDVKKPEIVKNEYSQKVIDVLSQPKIKNYISKTVGASKEIFYRRIQFNQIDQNCFVGYHLDIDSNPDYLAACVIQLGKEYKGGIYRVYQKDKSFRDFNAEYGSLIISNCEYPHEVTKVTKGNRKSLVFFISYSNGKNLRKR